MWNAKTAVSQSCDLQYLGFGKEHGTFSCWPSDLGGFCNNTCSPCIYTYPVSPTIVNNWPKVRVESCGVMSPCKYVKEETFRWSMMSAVQEQKTMEPKGKSHQSAGIISRFVYFHTLIMPKMQNVQVFCILQIPPKMKFLLLRSFAFSIRIALNAFQSIL